MIKLRTYQEKSIKKGLDFLNNSKKLPPSVIVAPVASGKAILIGNIASQLVEPTLVLQPSVELLYQNYEKFTMYGGEASIFSASAGIKDIGHTTYATLGSIKRLGKRFKEIGTKYLIADECHTSLSPQRGSMFRNFIDDLKPSKVLGLTATPIRLNQYGSMYEGWSQLDFLMKSKKGSPAFFKEILDIVPISLMVEEKYWANLNYELYDFDESTLMLNSTGTEFTEYSIQKSVSEQGINNNIFLKLKSLLKLGVPSILVFLDSVKSAQDMANLLGKDAGCITANSSKKDRESIVKNFKNGKLKIITNYGALGIGFNYPELSHVILGRPTNSLALYYQFLGRVTRNPLHPKQKQGYIIDFCNNTKRFGKIEDLNFEHIEGFGWGMFKNDTLLSSIPINSNPKPTKQTLTDRYSNPITSKLPEPMVQPQLSKDTLLVFDLNNISYILYKGNCLDKEGLYEYISHVAERVNANNFIIVNDGRDYFRLKIEDTYKGHRKKRDEKLLKQLYLLKKDIETHTVDNLEADDLVSNIVRNNDYKKVIVVSTDSDFKQFAVLSKYKQYYPLTRQLKKFTQLEAIQELITKILKGDWKDNVKKCHPNKAIKTVELLQCVKIIYKDIVDYVKKEGTVSITDVPLRDIFYKRLSTYFNVEESKFNRNFDLITLLHPIYTKYTKESESGLEEMYRAKVKTISDIYETTS